MERLRQNQSVEPATAAERRSRRKKRRYDADKELIRSGRGTKEEREAAQARINETNRQMETDIEMARQIQNEQEENKETERGNINEQTSEEAQRQRERERDEALQRDTSSRQRGGRSTRRSGRS